MQIGLATDPGRVRDRNEDSSLAWQFVLDEGSRCQTHVALLIVADGMGGYHLGEQASSLAVRLAADHIVRRVGLPMLSPDLGAGAPPQIEPLHEILAGGIRLAHEAIGRQLAGAGTTLTMALVIDDNIYLAHIGDSRAYIGERGRLTVLTQDHSVAARLAELGQTTAVEVARRRNQLYKAVGQGTELEPDVTYHALAPGQYLLLCCDGLWAALAEEEIVQIIDAATSPQQACRALVARANERGGADNVTALLAGRGWPARSGRAGSAAEEQRIYGP